MEFKTGDNVVYGGNVCQITEIKEMSFFHEAPKKHYVLEPVFSKQASIMYVPLDNEILVNRMQLVMDRDEAMALIATLSNCQTEWIEDKNKRKTEFGGIVTKGSREDIMRVIKTITNRQAELVAEGKKLNLQDEKVLNEAMNRINGELAIALGMSPEDVPSFVRETAYA